jgi:hypothetical protein
MQYVQRANAAGLPTPVNEVSPAKGNGLTAGTSQPVRTQTQNTHELDSDTTRQRGKAESTTIATLALAGHAVHVGRCGDYTVCKYGYSYFAQDLAALQSFAARLGVCNA